MNTPRLESVVDIVTPEGGAAVAEGAQEVAGVEAVAAVLRLVAGGRAQAQAQAQALAEGLCVIMAEMSLPVTMKFPFRPFR